MPQAIWLGLFFATFLPGCHSAKTPLEVCTSVLRGFREGDAGLIFDNLVESTQWSFHTVQKNHRRMRDLVAASYPERERTAAMARLFGADADSGRDLFSRLYVERYAAAWAAPLGPGTDAANKAEGQDRNAPRIMPNAERPGEFECQIPGLRSLNLARSASGRWGVTNLDAEWDQVQLRAIHDLETVEKNAALYRRIGAAAPNHQ